MNHPEDDALHESGQPIPVDGLPINPADLITSPRPVLEAKWKTLQQLAGDDWQTWFTTAPPRRQWLLERCRDGYNNDGERSEGVLPLGQVGMLAAAGGVGKTTALVQLALAVATGREWLDAFSTPNPGHVLLALGEEDEKEVRRRVFNAAKVMRLTHQQSEQAAQRIVLLPLAGTPVALTEGGSNGSVQETSVLAELRAHLQQSGCEWRLIILDPLSRFAGNDTEKDNSAATRFVQAVETLVRAPGGPTVMLAHHTTKASRGVDATSDANAARGASGLTDGVRWVANLDPVKSGDDCVELRVTKSNYSRRGGPLTLVREDGGALRAERRDEYERRRQAQSTEAPRRMNARKREEPAEAPEDRFQV
jgi:hypothetical protein